MAIRIKYFASLRDIIGRGEDQLSCEGEITVAELWSRLCPELPLPPNTLCAVNLEYADLDRRVRDNDEVAFFPPVTGGRTVSIDDED
jgi:molybdopterin synthase sulfur carrier subunit